MTLSLCFALTAALISSTAESSRDRVEAWIDTRIDEWRFNIGDVEGAERPDFDDSTWEKTTIGHKWLPHDSICWFRTTFIVPESIMGLPTEGKRLRLLCAMDNEAMPYINGIPQDSFKWWEGDIVLSENVTPGEKITIALKGINRPGYGQFLDASLVTDGQRRATNTN